MRQKLVEKHWQNNEDGLNIIALDSNLVHNFGCQSNQSWPFSQLTCNSDSKNSIAFVCGTAEVRGVLGLGERAPLKLWALENRPALATSAAAVVMHAVGDAGMPKVAGLKVRHLDKIKSRS